MSAIRISHPDKKIKARVRIPGSKSESNRLLILNALTGNHLNLENLSTARDTQNLLKILTSGQESVDVIDAGTSMRFLTAFYCATNQHKVITGDERMKRRPVGPLVNALNELGFNVQYRTEGGFPPLEICPVNMEHLNKEAFIEGNVSSQFITALLLIAPVLPNGLKINFTSELISKPYVEMTLNLLKHFGVLYDWTADAIEIKNSVKDLSKNMKAGTYSIHGDWSAASYWYSIAFLADEAEIFIEGLKDDWNQGDRTIADWMRRFGITTEFTPEGATLKKVKVEYPMMMKLNFRDNPDLAQTFAVMFAAGNIYATFSGLESLRLKETDRIAALQQELRRMDMHLDYSDMYELYQLKKGQLKIPATAINTYNDHRMAMSFAALALLGEIKIKDPEVVQKSYPEFWTELEKAGFKISSVQRHQALLIKGQGPHLL